MMDIRHRWETCTADGKLTFNWKCMMTPLKMVDYIFLHELAHLIYPNHSPSVWNQLNKIMPDYQERKEWLRTNGVGMDL